LLWRIQHSGSTHRSWFGAVEGISEEKDQVLRSGACFSIGEVAKKTPLPLLPGKIEEKESEPSESANDMDVEPPSAEDDAESESFRECLNRNHS